MTTFDFFNLNPYLVTCQWIGLFTSKTMTLRTGLFNIPWLSSLVLAKFDKVLLWTELVYKPLNYTTFLPSRLKQGVHKMGSR